MILTRLHDGRLTIHLCVDSVSLPPHAIISYAVLMERAGRQIARARWRRLRFARLQLARNEMSALRAREHAAWQLELERPHPVHTGAESFQSNASGAHRLAEVSSRVAPTATTTHTDGADKRSSLAYGRSIAPPPAPPFAASWATHQMASIALAPRAGLPPGFPSDQLNCAFVPRRSTNDTVR